MPRKIFLRLMSFFCLVIFLAGCATTPVQTVPAPKVLEPSPAPPALNYDSMIARSLLSPGNNVRLKAAIAKAKAGGDVTLAFTGGSITEGAGATSNGKCYVSLSADSFKSLFGKGAALNAGMSGTPSTLGMIRYQRDVVQRLGRNPDVVFIEFAVNDSGEPTNGAAYESLVRDILSARNKPAVVLLFAVFRTQWNMQDRYIPVGKAYDLPMISILNAVVPELRSGAITSKKFFADEYHPTDYGHQIMSDCITSLFKTVDAAPADPKDITLPATAVIGKQYQGIKMIDSAHVPAGVTMKAGSFSEKDNGLGTFIYAPTMRTFPDNWYKKDPNANDPFTMTLACRSLFLVYKLSPLRTFGTAEVSIDGKPVKSVMGSEGGGWNNPVTEMILNEDKAARHTVTIKMADDSAAKYFTILAFGYTN